MSLEQSIPYFYAALEFSPISKFEVPEQLSNRIVAFASQIDTEEEKALFNQGLQLAKDSLERNIKESPQDFRYQLFLSRFYVNLYQISSQQEFLDSAETVLQEAQKLSPKNEQVYWLYAQISIHRGEYEQAEGYLKEAIALEPRLSQSHWYLSLVYLMQKKYDPAYTEAKESFRLGYISKASLTDLKQAVDIYRVKGDNAGAIPLLEAALQIDPNDYELWAVMADLWAGVGEKEKAKQAAEKVLELKPDKQAEIDEFLKALGY
jgi:tetratricopeptide (TPR) repeat protein